MPKILFQHGFLQDQSLLPAVPKLYLAPIWLKMIKSTLMFLNVDFFFPYNIENCFILHDLPQISHTEENVYILFFYHLKIKADSKLSIVLTIF